MNCAFVNCLNVHTVNSVFFFTMSLTSAQVLQQVLDFIDEIKEKLIGDYDPSEVTKSLAIANSVTFSFDLN